ncbi:hypothetical protein ABEY04_13760 [Bacillus mycoides]|uniref:hypothetical protein n=1 Tax=Bacillus mycoides TaxID=1405 RepID=UPI003D1DF833
MGVNNNYPQVGHGGLSRMVNLVDEDEKSDLPIWDGSQTMEKEDSSTIALLYM